MTLEDSIGTRARFVWLFACLSTGLLLVGCEPSDSFQPADGARTGSPGAGSGQPGSGSDEGPESLVDLTVAVSHDVSIALDPAPKKEGGNLFLAGFIKIDEAVGAPHEGAFPDHYLPAAIWVSDFPWRGELELVPGLHYFARYGHGALPQPGDRVSEPLKVPASADEALEFVVQGRPKTLNELGRRIDAGVPEEMPDGTLSPLRSPPGQEILDVPFVINLADDLEQEPGPYRIAVAGFSVAEAGLVPTEVQKPVYLWTAQPSEAAFPKSVVLPIPKGLSVLVFAAMGDGFAFDESALRGDFLPPRTEVGGSVSYVLKEMPAADPGRTTSPPDQEVVDVPFVIELGSGIEKSRGMYQVAVVGFSVEEDSPLPTEDEEPTYRWVGPRSETEFPRKVVLPIPKGLTVLVSAAVGPEFSFDESALRGAFLPPRDSAGGTVRYILQKASADPGRSSSTPGQEVIDVPFVIELGSGLEGARGAYRVGVMGFSVEGDSPLPTDEEEPTYQWTGQPSEAAFPRSVTLPIPKGLTVLISAAAAPEFSFDESALRGAFLPPRDSAGGTVRYILQKASADPGRSSSTPGQEVIDVPFVIELGSGLEGARGAYRVGVMGFSVEGDSPVPAVDQKPTYQWTGQPSDAAFPRSVTLPIPKGLTVLVSAAAGPEFTFDESALSGAFLPPATEVTGSVRYSLEKSGSDEGGKGSSLRLEADEGVAYEPVALTVTLGSGSPKKKPSGRLLVIGTRSGPEGRDSERPAFYWSSEEIYSRWPTKLEALVPSGLDVRIVLDQNEDMSPDSGDLTGDILPTFEVPESGGMEFVLDRAYNALLAAEAAAAAEAEQATRDLVTEPFPGTSK